MKHKLEPTIINPKSNFVVVTYWWGRGNLNKNTQRPCPEDLEEGQKITRKPKTYDDMIDLWIKNCIKAKCNYLVEEYPEFAKPGMYQEAINHKPVFIKEALLACQGRGVLYIDGDMVIRKHPYLFELLNVDFMGFSYNVDLRFFEPQKTICLDPFTFETSGGTLFFGNTQAAIKLLDLWEQESAKNRGKADDRILSMTLIKHNLIHFMNVVHLPEEYLWLTTEYVGRKSNVYISHPECLTGEEMAAREGAARDRFPKRYDYYVTNNLTCMRSKDKFFEYIFCDKSKRIATSLSLFNSWLQKKKAIELIKFDKKYGPFNKIAKQNKLLSKKIAIDKNIQHRVVLDINVGIPTIIAHLKKGIDVCLTANGSSALRIIKLYNKYPWLELIAKNTAKRKNYLICDLKSPIYLSSNSSVLLHLLYMSNDMKSFSKLFNESSMFLNRIRCRFL